MLFHCHKKSLKITKLLSEVIKEGQTKQGQKDKHWSTKTVDRKLNTEQHEPPPKKKYTIECKKWNINPTKKCIQLNAKSETCTTQILFYTIECKKRNSNVPQYYQALLWFDLIWFVFNATFSNISAISWATRFSGGRSRSTRREPPTMGKQLVNFTTCGCESSAPFFVIYKAGHEPMLYWW